MDRCKLSRTCSLNTRKRLFDWVNIASGARTYRARSSPPQRDYSFLAKRCFRAAGYTPGSKHPRHWARGNERRRRLFGNGDCRVYGFGKWWVLQRRDGVDSHTQVLVFSLGPWLIATRTYAAAIRLAEYCSPHAPDPLGLYSWQNTR